MKVKKKIKIKSYKLDEILTLNNINKIDFINIDTEGNELDILKSINFDRINPSLFSIEENSFFLENDSKKAKISLMKEKNYELINIIGVTMFFVKKDAIASITDWIKI